MPLVPPVITTFLAILLIVLYYNIRIKNANNLSYYLINLLNPLNFAQHTFEKQGFKMLLKNVRINGSDVVTSGSVFVKKS